MPHGVLPLSFHLFKKLICNLLLDLHPICVNRWMHPICIKFIHKYYLNFQTVRAEYNKHTRYYKMFKPLHSTINNTLVFGVTHGNIIIVKWCLENGADIYYNNDMAIKYAVERGDVKIIKFLINQGSDIHYDDDKALEIACSHYYLDLIKFLIENGAVITRTCSIEVLIYASRNGRADIVQILLAAGMNTNYDALIYASQNGHLEVVQTLLKYINPEFSNNACFKQARILALRNGHTDIVRVLSEFKNEK